MSGKECSPSGCRPCPNRQQEKSRVCPGRLVNDCPGGSKKQELCGNPDCPYKRAVDGECNIKEDPNAVACGNQDCKANKDKSPVCDNPKCPFNPETYGKEFCS